VESYQAGMGHLPIRGPYECLTFSAGITVLFYLWVEWKFKTRTFGAFVVSFAASILFVLNGAGIITPTNALKKLFISSDLLDDMSYKMIAIGFVMFSIMIVTGMFRSKIIWGSYWEWDPVETWSLLTWIVYAVILHGRYTWKWRSGITAILSIIGFGLSVVSFLIGAGFVSSSLHFPITG